MSTLEELDVLYVEKVPRVHGAVAPGEPLVAALNFLRSTLIAAKPQWGCWDSNPEPKDYESSALTVELQPQAKRSRSISTCAISCKPDGPIIPNCPTISVAARIRKGLPVQVARMAASTGRSFGRSYGPGGGYQRQSRQVNHWKDGFRRSVFA